MSVLDFNARISYRDFSLDVAHPFELAGITALFGPSGCGKSTMLRIIAGLETTAEGRVVFGAETWLDTANKRFTPPHRRAIGYVFQDARLFPHLTVRGNLRYADKRSAGTGPSIAFDDVVDAFELAPLLARRPHALSGGEKQRVAIARALLTRPRLLMMDEPLAALDVRRKADILPYIERLTDNFGVPIIYVTHSIDEVIRLADVMVVLSGGRKLGAGPVTEILERREIQAAMGKFEAGVALDATVAAHDHAFKLTELDFNGTRILMPFADLDIGARVRIRVRARDVALALTPPSDISVRNILPGKIIEIEAEPETAFAETLIDIGGVHLRARVTRKTVHDLGLTVGKPVFALLKSVSFDRRLLPDRGRAAPTDSAL